MVADQKKAAAGSHEPLDGPDRTGIVEGGGGLDDDDVGLLRTIAHARDEARIVVRTLLTETRFGARVDVTPERERLRQVRQLSAVTDFSLA